MKQPFWLFILKFLFLVLVYYSTATFGLHIAPVSGFATLVWLPTGISLAIVLLWGYKFLPAIMIGAFAANLTLGAPLPAAAGIAIGNTLEALTGAFLLRRSRDFHFSLDRVIDILGLLVYAGLISTFISATVGVTSLYLTQVVPLFSFQATWIVWWIGDLVSCVIITPLILVWNEKFTIPRKFIRIFEIVMWLFVIIIAGYIIFLDGLATSDISIIKAYWVFPPLIWSALRFGQRGTVTAIFVLSVAAVWGTYLDLGPFAETNISDNLLSLQVFMVVISVSSLVLVAVVSEREQLENRKNYFISIASHELKAPITSAKSYLQYVISLLKKEQDPKFRKSVDVLEKSNAQLDKMTVLINDLLDLSKIQSGKLELRPKRFDVDNFVKENIDSFQRTILSHKVKREGLVKRKIYGDEFRLSQVITNLLTNAAKYSPQADTIIVSAVANTRFVTIQITDFGSGISRQAQKKIFEPFFQVNETKKDGLGLGLFISGEIVKAHGGTISVTSMLGKGSTFSIHLPIKSTKKPRLL